MRYPPLSTFPTIIVGSGKYVGHRTLAELQALGTATSPAVAVGSTGFDTTNRLPVYALTASASSSTWGYKRQQAYPFAYSEAAAAALVKVDWVSNIDTGSDSYVNMLIAPHAGRFVRCTLKCDTGGPPGVTAIAVNKGVAGADPTVGLDSQSVDMVSADVTYSVNFDDGATFAAGDTLNLTIDPTGNHGNITGQVVIEWIITDTTPAAA